MQSKLGLICDRIIEAGWLAAAVFTPLYFNVYSSRVFEPDKISMLRNIVLMMTLAWFMKLIESAPGEPQRGQAGQAALEAGGAAAGCRRPCACRWSCPSPYTPSSISSPPSLSVVPLTSFFGSYQRMQGMISQYTYIVLALMIMANMRSRAQLERLITFAIVTSVPVALYGLLQASGARPPALGRATCKPASPRAWATPSSSPPS